jgi:hypothetical protein
MIKIFQGYDSASDIIAEVENNGIAGISGGRLEVRAKMKEISNIVNQESGIIAQTTYNHPSTELGFVHDDTYDSKDAKDKIILSFDSI